MGAEYSLAEQIEELERELRIREKVYPRWVNASKPKLSPAQSERQLGRMRAALATLRSLQGRVP